MATHSAASHNPAVRSSGKVRSSRFAMTEAKIAACRLVKSLGLVPSFRNLHIIELAITAESNFSSISIQQATDQILHEARVGLECGESLDYFWFEDCRWRNPKLSFKERDEKRMREKARWY
ncbi:MAG TPA: hypothetical protein VHZ28_06170 [Terracidiphilus sp.]|jgi:hypothetical protein|nr:hypothetical protein [Terracidiphilus sp.]